MAVEVDWGTIAVDHPDHSLTQHILDATQGLVAQPWAGRELRNWFKRAGLRHVRVRPVAVATTSLDAARFDQQVKTIATDGFLERDVVEQWLEELREMADEGQFLYSVTAYLAVGTKRGHRHRGHNRHRFASADDQELGRAAGPEALTPRPAPHAPSVGGEREPPEAPVMDDSGADGRAAESGAGVDPSGGPGTGASPDARSSDAGSGADEEGETSGNGSGVGADDDGGSGSAVAESGIAVADEPAPLSGSGSGAVADDRALSRVPQPGENRHAAEEDELEWSEEADEPAGSFTAEPVQKVGSGSGEGSSEGSMREVREIHLSEGSDAG